MRLLNSRVAVLPGFRLCPTSDPASQTQVTMNITTFRRISAALNDNACPERVYPGEA